MNSLAANSETGQQNPFSAIISSQTEPFWFVKLTEMGREEMRVSVRTVSAKSKPWQSKCFDCGLIFTWSNNFSCEKHHRFATKVRLEISGLNDPELPAQKYICSDIDGNPLTLANVFALKSRIEGEIIKGTFNIWRYLPRKKKKFLFENYVQGYLADIGRRGRLPHSDDEKCSIAHCRDVGYAFKNHLLPHLKDFDIVQINEGVIMDFRNSLNTNSLKRKCLGYLSALLRWAKRRGDIQVLPLYPQIKLSRKKKIGLSGEAQQAIFEQIPERHKPIFRWAMETGRRSGEIPALKVQDVDFKKNIMLDGKVIGQGVYRLSGALDRGKYKPYPKVKDTAGSEFPFSDEMIEILKAALKDRISRPDDFVFLNPDTGKAYTYSLMRDTFARARKAAGFSPAEVQMNQWARHTKAQRLIEGGATMEETAAFLAHKDPATTRKNYATMTAGVMVEIAKKVKKNQAKVADLIKFKEG